MVDQSIVSTGVQLGAFQITESGIRTVEQDAPNGRAIEGFPQASLSPLAQPQRAELPPINPLQSSMLFAEQQLARQSAPAPKPFTVTPGAVLKLARHRLKQLNAEIRRLKALEREREQLTRLIAAATSKPKAAVRALRSPSVG
jgi:hypothetical protein